MDSAAVSIAVPISPAAPVSVLWGNCPELTLLDHREFCFSFLLYSIAAVSYALPSDRVQQFQLPTPSTALFVLCSHDNSHPNSREVISHKNNILVLLCMFLVASDLPVGHLDVFFVCVLSNFFYQYVVVFRVQGSHLLG